MKRLALFAVGLYLLPFAVGAQTACPIYQQPLCPSGQHVQQGTVNSSTGCTSAPQCVSDSSSQPAVVTLVQPGQPSNGQALPGGMVAAVAITVQSSAPVNVTGIKVQKVGSANNAAIASLKVNTDATTVVGTASGFDANNSVTIPVTATISGSKTFLVSAVMASNLTPYAGQSFELNITAVMSDAVSTSGVLPVYGAQFLITTGVAKPTCSISASTGTYRVGQTVNVSWKSSNATGGTITGIGNVGPSGLQGILPGGQSQTLVGTFTGPGGTGTCSLTLTLTSATGGTISGSDTVGEAGKIGAPGGGETVTPGVGSGVTGNVAVPSGGAKPASNIIPCSGLDCRPCDLAALAQNVINYLIGLTIPLAAVMFAWAGILYFTSATNPANIEKAKAVFKVVLWGFLIAVGAYIAIQLMLRTLLGAEYKNWNSIQCVDSSLRAGSILPGADGKGGNTTNIGQFFGSLGGINTNAPSPITISTGGSMTGSACPSGSTYSNAIGGCVDNTTGECTYSDCGGGVNANSYVRQNFSGAGCSGMSAQAACVAGVESSCNPLLGSGVDIGSDGNAMSWGLFQVNLSANALQCNGQRLNCPSAFSGGAYTSRNHGTYVSNQALFNQCVELAQDSQCSSQMFEQLRAERNGSIRAWGNAAYNKCSGL